MTTIRPYTKQACEEWLKDRSRNPLTKRRIRKGKPSYRMLEDKCKEFGLIPSYSRSPSPKPKKAIQSRGRKKVKKRSSSSSSVSRRKNRKTLPVLKRTKSSPPQERNTKHKELPFHKQKGIVYKGKIIPGLLGIKPPQTRSRSKSKTKSRSKSRSKSKTKSRSKSRSKSKTKSLKTQMKHSRSRRSNSNSKTKSSTKKSPRQSSIKKSSKVIYRGNSPHEDLLKDLLSNKKGFTGKPNIIATKPKTTSKTSEFPVIRTGLTSAELNSYLKKINKSKHLDLSAVKLINFFVDDTIFVIYSNVPSLKDAAIIQNYIKRNVPIFGPNWIEEAVYAEDIDTRIYVQLKGISPSIKTLIMHTIESLIYKILLKLTENKKNLITSDDVLYEFLSDAHYYKTFIESLAIENLHQILKTSGVLKSLKKQQLQHILWMIQLPSESSSSTVQELYEKVLSNIGKLNRIQVLDILWTEIST